MQSEPFELIKLREINENEIKYDVWMECKTAFQLFYSEENNKFLLNDFKNITLFNKYENLKLDAGIKGPIELLAYNENLKAIAYCIDRANGINYRSLKNQTQSKFKDPKDILHIEWLSNKCQADFLVVQETGLRFLKMEDEKKGFKQMKFISMKISACWFQWKTQTLVTCNYQDKGILSIFHLRDKKNKNLFRSGSLQLQFKDELPVSKKNEKSIKFKVASTTSHQPLFHKSYSEPFQVQVVYLYERPVIILLNLMDGLLDFYQIQQNEVIKLPLAINLPTDSPADITIYDNLVLIHLKNDHISFVYDTKRAGTQPVATPAAIGEDNIYLGQIMNRWIILSDKRVFKWQLQPEAIFKYIKAEGQLFLFLMRRRNCKMIVLKWIRDTLFEIRATVVSNFFKVIFAEHTDSLKLGQNLIIQQTISPTDMYANVFFPLQSDSRKDRLADLMLECQRQLIINKLDVPPKFQELIVKLLLQSRRQILLGQLVQSRLIQESKEMAIFLYQSSLNSQKFQVLQQVAIDILYRQGLYCDLIQMFSKLGLISQLIRIVRKHFEQIPLQVLINIFRDAKEQNKVKLRTVLRDLGRECYPISSEQYLTVELQKC